MCILQYDQRYILTLLVFLLIRVYFVHIFQPYLEAKTQRFNLARGYPVYASCVCSIFSCDFAQDAQLHIKAAVRTASFGELKRLV